MKHARRGELFNWAIKNDNSYESLIASKNLWLPLKLISI